MALSYKEEMIERNAATRAKTEFLKEERGVAYNFIADKVGISPAAFHSWLKGRRSFREENLSKVEAIFKFYIF